MEWLSIAWDLLSGTWRSFSRHGGTLLGGAIAFFAMLSAAPLLVIALAVAGWASGEAAARAELERGLALWLGPEGARSAGLLLENARAEGAGALVGGLSLLALVYGSSRLFTQLQRALNHFWGVRSRVGTGFKGRAWKQLRRRLVAFVMVLLCGLVLLASVFLRAGIHIAMRVLPSGLGDRWHLVDRGLSFVVVTALFAAVFKVLPDVRIAWRDALAGAAVTALLFGLGKGLVGWYLARKSPATSFGAAGSLVLVLLWVNYSAQIFFLGAAFTAELARVQGRPLEPTEHAIRVHEEEALAGDHGAMA